MTAAPHNHPPPTPAPPGRTPRRTTPRPPRRHRLIYGTVNEDPAVETAVLPTTGRLLVIASGGDIALHLAAQGADVTAVDSNPAQLAYVRDRIAGAPPRGGSVEHMQRLTRAALTLAGWRHTALTRFCSLDDPTEQIRQWHDRFNTRRLRAILALLTSPASIRATGFSAFTSHTALRFDILLRTRLERGLARHPNRDNPFLHRLLLGTPTPTPPIDPARITLIHTDVAHHLESVPPASYDGFSLSNVLDGTGPEYAHRLGAALRRAAAPGAIAVSRSFTATDDPAATEWAIRDRSMLWGAVRIEHPGQTP